MLVAGWYSDFRGLLWIHAASLEPEDEGLREREDHYREVFGLSNTAKGEMQLPKNYPTSCLLGLVNVVDVADAQSFEQWPELPPCAKAEGGANGSDYFFLCENQQRLLMPFPMSGQHKLWRLDKKVAKDALLGLRPCEQMPIDFLFFRDQFLVSQEKLQEQAKAQAQAAQVEKKGSSIFDAASAAPPAAAAKPSLADLSPAELPKREKNLRKLLKQIGELASKRASGTALTAEQDAKLLRQEEAKAEMEEIQRLIAQSQSQSGE